MNTFETNSNIAEAEKFISRWRLQRFFSLFAGIAFFAMGIFVEQPLRPLRPVFFFFLGAFLITSVVINWRGTKEIKLIEKLKNDLLVKNENT